MPRACVTLHINYLNMRISQHRLINVMNLWLWKGTTAAGPKELYIYELTAKARRTMYSLRTHIDSCFKAYYINEYKMLVQ